jgi:hypothetical protein
VQNRIEQLEARRNKLFEQDINYLLAARHAASTAVQQEFLRRIRVGEDVEDDADVQMREES